MDKRRITGAEAVIRCLEAEGVTDVFGLPGGAILPLYDAWANVDQASATILVRHEQGAGHMAEGYARATGKVGVCIGTSGPGATNLVTADRRRLHGLHADGGASPGRCRPT